jgi:SAM-dependent methyltransferase
MEEIEECIVCGNQTFQFVTGRGQYFSKEKVLFCRDCALVFLSPRMTEKESDEFYKSDEFSRKFRGKGYPTPAMCAYRDARAKQRLEFLMPYLEQLPKGPFLEIGCSSGSFLKYIQKLGFETFGIDPSTGFVEYAKRENGLRVFAGTYPDELPDSFRKNFVATAIFQVLEHMHDPRKILSNIYSGLVDGGYLFIEVPDIERVATSRKWIHPYYFQKSHFWDFGESNFCRLLSTAGFRIDKIVHHFERPHDKNMLVVAIKQVTDASDFPDTDNNLRSFPHPRTIYCLLKFKLFLGIGADILGRIFRRNRAKS